MRRREAGDDVARRLALAVGALAASAASMRFPSLATSLSWAAGDPPLEGA